MKIDYKLYLSIIFAIVICGVLFFGYAYLAPNLPTDKDVLSNWITVLIFLVTVSAGVMPLVLNDRQDKFQEKTESKFKELQKETDEKISKIENHYKEQNEKIEKNYKTTFNAISHLFKEQMIKYLTKFEQNQNNNLLPYQKQDLFYDALNSIASYINVLTISQDKQDFNNAIIYINTYKEKLKNSFNDEQTKSRLQVEMKTEKYFVSREKLKDAFKDDAEQFIEIFQFLYDEFDKKD